MEGEKIEFTNKPYEYILKSVLLFLVTWNIYAYILTMNSMALLPITVNSIVLLIVMTRYKVTKFFVKGWALIFFILASTIVILTSALRVSIDELLDQDFLYRIARILFGLFIFIGANRFIKKERKEALRIDDHLVD